MSKPTPPRRYRVVSYDPPHVLYGTVTGPRARAEQLAQAIGDAIVDPPAEAERAEQEVA
jgi:hypothetical protein